MLWVDWPKRQNANPTIDLVFYRLCSKQHESEIFFKDMTHDRFLALICHFGDSLYVNLAIQSISFLHPETQIIVLDNSGNFVTDSSIVSDSAHVEVLQTGGQTRGAASEQHASALNWALKNLEQNSDFIIVMDSDLICTKPSQLKTILKDLIFGFDAIVALEAGSRSLSHPCFMVFRTSLSQKLDFALGMGEFGFDTGRLIGLQLAQLGERVKKLVAVSTKLTPHGDYYPEAGVVHLKSSSLGHMKKNFRPMDLFWNFKQISRKEIATRVFLGKNFSKTVYIKAAAKLVLWKIKGEEST